MQFKTLFALTALAATAAVAAPTGGDTTPPTAPAPGPAPGQCNTGPIQCCNSVQKANNPVASLLLGLLGVVVNDLSIPIGITCSPLNIIGIGGNSCNAQPVCCNNNNFNGIIAIGCLPININL